MNMHSSGLFLLVLVQSWSFGVPLQETNSPKTESDEGLEFTLDLDSDGTHPWGMPSTDGPDFFYLSDILSLNDSMIDYLKDQGVYENLLGQPSVQGIWGTFNTSEQVKISFSDSTKKYEVIKIDYFMHASSHVCQASETKGLDIMIEVTYRNRSKVPFSIVEECGFSSELEVWKTCSYLIPEVVESGDVSQIEFFFQTASYGDVILLDKIGIGSKLLYSRQQSTDRVSTSPCSPETTTPVFHDSSEDTTSNTVLSSVSVSSTSTTTTPSSVTEPPEVTSTDPPLPSSGSTEASSPSSSSEMTESSSPWSESTIPSTPPATTESKSVDATPVFLLSTLLPILINALT